MVFIKHLSISKSFTIKNSTSYLHSLSFLKVLQTELLFFENVTFFIGENGSGKTTLIEALAYNLGLNRYGGSLNFVQNNNKIPELTNYLII